MGNERDSVAELRRPETIRARCRALADAARAGGSEFFTVHPERLGEAADLVAAVTREHYPDLRIPPHSRWGHFQAGGVNRLAELDRALAGVEPREQARRRFELVIVSVLLDAGAGPDWRYREPATGQQLSRSEGLAVASFRMFLDGAFSSEGRPEADGGGLAAFTAESLAEGFQVSADNPLVGLEGRASLVRSLAAAMAARPDIFAESARLGALADRLLDEADEGPLAARDVLAAVLSVLGPVWPGRIELDGVNLGDVWRHPAVGLVPFHKLSQWLTYSLIDPLERAGLAVVEQDALTGLPEYRNGGLLLDSGALALRDPALAAQPWPVDHPLVVEWRALTVALLDELAPLVRARLGADLTMGQILEGGTWAAGRRLAALRRAGAPPLTIISDGTVF